MFRMKLGFLMLIVLAWVPGRASAQCATATLQTKQGPVCGVIQSTPTGKSADAYLGIPFGEPTGGANRWRAPRPKQPWHNVLNAVSYGPVCPQPASNTTTPPQSEDCLSLNVWAPAGYSGSSPRLPVMVFIPGGGFIQGSGSDPAYNGSYLAANYDVLVVTLNYRVGMLGFLAADGLEGNYGIRDQQLAMRWVQDNIAPFGGDPAKVTLFGESAGAISVGLHATVVPSSRPLFRSAITESNLLGLPLMATADARTAGTLFKQLAGCQTIDCLRALPVATILSAQGSYQSAAMGVFTGWSGYNPIAPVIDGQLIVGQPIRAIEGATGLKPMLVGTNLNEGTWFSGQIAQMAGPNAFNLSVYTSFIAGKFGPQAQRLTPQYGAPSSDNSARYTQMFTDYVFTCSNHVLAEKAATSPRSLHIYQFTQHSAFNLSGVPACADMVCHTDELPYVFHSASLLGFTFTAADNELSEQMMTYWTNFAKTLDPNAPVKPHVSWPAIDKTSRNYIYLNAELKAGAPPISACPLLDSIGYVLVAPPPH